MKIVGLTGGIGSGKSTVAKILQHLHIPVFYADDVAKKLVESTQLKPLITNVLGELAYSAEGRYNRSWVANQIFENPSLLSQLNGIIHPAVKNEFERWITHQDTPMVVKEAALIQSPVGYDEIWVVFAPLSIRMERIQKRDPQRTLDQIQAIIQHQPSDDFFKSIATHGIQNGPYDILTTQILKIL